MFQDVLELHDNYRIAAIEDIFITLLDSAAFVKIGHMDRSIVKKIVKKIVAKCRRNLGSDDQVIDSSANA